MKYIIQKRIKGNNFKDKPPITNMKIQQIKGIDYAIQIFFENEENLKKVLIGLPTELDKIKTKFSKKGKIKQLFHYDNWIKYDKYNAYHLAEKLDIPTCPYCGRMYTKTVISEKGKKIVRPDFDHWFPKSKYPLLALSFYNLIPSCNICNSRLKGAYDFELDTHFHPYHKVDDLKFTFSYDLDAYEKPRVKIVTENDFSKDSVKAFELEEIYKTHQDEVEDLLKIRQAYSENYIEILNKTLEGANLTREEVYRLAFGAHLAEDKFDRRPLSKIKKDILTELGIVKLK
ncbi:hypothetical protein CGC58_11735 [Capnocytophaga stomatis]|uniref:HNH domain-containing protein n=2 Tax=Capnocytophaga stomatis TaxID=1848904 RepID=A0A250FZ23_9FLAO|nr:hypothetical protein CGC58_11735 [Capnocytophaga stomatis]